MRENVCCLCGERYRGYGNNPWPMSDDPDARCCDRCNMSKVIPARILRSIYRSSKMLAV